MNKFIVCSIEYEFALIRIVWLSEGVGTDLAYKGDAYYSHNKAIVLGSSLIICVGGKQLV